MKSIINRLPRTSASTAKGLFMAVFLLAIGCLSSMASGNLLTNPDFSQSYAGFSSQYANEPVAGGAGTYFVGSSPVEFRDGARDYPDHTTGNGLMFIANGPTVDDLATWAQTVAVTPQTNYEFSAWVASWSLRSLNPARLEVLINGQSIGEHQVVPGNSGDWMQFSYQWNSGISTNAQISIIDRVLEPSGNDFSLDDLSFTVIPEPTILGTMLISFCGLRRRL